MADYNRAIAIDSNHANAYYNRGLVWRKLGNKQKAIEDLKIAAELYKKQDNMARYQQAMKDLAQLE